MMVIWHNFCPLMHVLYACVPCMAHNPLLPEGRLNVLVAPILNSRTNLPGDGIDLHNWLRRDDARNCIRRGGYDTHLHLPTLLGFE